MSEENNNIDNNKDLINNELQKLNEKNNQIVITKIKHNIIQKIIDYLNDYTLYDYKEIKEIINNLNKNKDIDKINKFFTYDNIMNIISIYYYNKFKSSLFNVCKENILRSIYFEIIPNNYNNNIIEYFKDDLEDWTFPLDYNDINLDLPIDNNSNEMIYKILKLKNQLYNQISNSLITHEHLIFELDKLERKIINEINDIKKELLN